MFFKLFATPKIIIGVLLIIVSFIYIYIFGEINFFCALIFFLGVIISSLGVDKQIKRLIKVDINDEK